MQIEVAKTVGVSPAAVFAAVADIAGWPQFIASVARVEALTPGRLRVGARFRVACIMLGQEATEELEAVEIARPRRLRLAGQSRGLFYERDHIVDALPDGARLTLIFRTRPAGETERAALPFLTPLMEISLRDELERDLADFSAAARSRSPGRRV